MNPECCEIPGIQWVSFLNRRNCRSNEPEEFTGELPVAESLRLNHEFPFIFHGEDTHKGYHKIHRGQEWIEIGPDCPVIDALPDRILQDPTAGTIPLSNLCGIGVFL